jgi:hypothetical protein
VDDAPIWEGTSSNDHDTEVITTSINFLCDSRTKFVSSLSKNGVDLCCCPVKGFLGVWGFGAVTVVTVPTPKNEDAVITSHCGFTTNCWHQNIFDTQHSPYELTVFLHSTTMNQGDRMVEKYVPWLVGFGEMPRLLKIDDETSANFRTYSYVENRAWVDRKTNPLLDQLTDAVCGNAMIF